MHREMAPSTARAMPMASTTAREAEPALSRAGRAVLMLRTHGPVAATLCAGHG